MILILLFVNKIIMPKRATLTYTSEDKYYKDKQANGAPANERLIGNDGKETARYASRTLNEFKKTMFIRFDFCLLGRLLRVADVRGLNRLRNSVTGFFISLLLDCECDRRVYNYSCAFSREPSVLITDANVASMPVRKIDGASVIDTRKYYVKLNCVDGGVTNVRGEHIRGGSREPSNVNSNSKESSDDRSHEDKYTIERQRRFFTSAFNVPIAYMDANPNASKENSSRFLYIIKDALVEAHHT